MFYENAVQYLKYSECKGFHTFAIVFGTPENLLVGMAVILEMKESHFVP